MIPFYQKQNQNFEKTRGKDYEGKEQMGPH